MNQSDLALFLTSTTDHDGGRCRSSLLYGAAIKWLALQSKPTVSQKAFTQAMIRAGYRKIESNGMHFVGLSLAKSAPADRDAFRISSDAARLARRRLREALDECYDEKLQGYRGNRSDATLAKEFCLSIGAVQKIREEDYGPIRPVKPMDTSTVKLLHVSAELAKLQKQLQETLNGVTLIANCVHSAVEIAKDQKC